MTACLRWLFFAVLVRPLVLILLGLRVRHRPRLPLAGPLIVVANHNSHLDTLVLMTLFPQACLPALRPVAAADYFLRHRLLAWFALQLIGIIPLSRRLHGHSDPLAGCDAALARGDILILFPEGSRGEPEALAEFKSGIAHLARRHPAVPVLPVFMRGLGWALPKGELILVPRFVDVAIGEPLVWQGDKAAYMQALRDRLLALEAELPPVPWDRSGPTRAS